MKAKLFSLVLILCLLCGCASQAQPAVTESPEAVTFTDDLGRTVTVRRRSNFRFPRMVRSGQQSIATTRCATRIAST